MNDLEEYEQLKKDQRKIKNKIRNIENTDDKKNYITNLM